MTDIETLLYGNHIMILHEDRDKLATFEQWQQMVLDMTLNEVRDKKIEAVKANDWNKAVHWRQIEKLKLNENGNIREAI
jgi:uncharacterized iron-regulated protein